jgi:hypothetical protein
MRRSFFIRPLDEPATDFAMGIGDGIYPTVLALRVSGVVNLSRVALHLPWAAFDGKIVGQWIESNAGWR